jgi:amidase
MDQFSFTPAWKVASLIREGKVSSQDFTRHIFERIRKYNPVLNSVVATMEKSAMQRAKEADDAVKEGIIWGPLHGVPVTVKDQFEIEGLVTTGGDEGIRRLCPED